MDLTNSSRANLTVSLKCSECGSTLNVKYKVKDDEKKGSHINANSANDMGVEIQVIPCHGCIDKVISPAKALADALRKFADA